MIQYDTISSLDTLIISRKLRITFHSIVLTSQLWLYGLCHLGFRSVADSTRYGFAMMLKETRILHLISLPWPLAQPS